jgi:hypothetical protein
MRSHARCSSREAARFAISKHCRARNRHSLGSPSIMTPTFLPGGSPRLSATGACYRYVPSDEINMRAKADDSESSNCQNPINFSLGVC